MEGTVAKGPGTEGETEGMDLAQLVTRFEDAEEATDQPRKLAERDRDYYDHKQLTSAELATLKEREQPDIIINRVQPKIDYLLGYEATTRTDPRAFPRTPQDDEAAEAATDALRYVEDATELDQKFSAGWENLLIEGFEGIELGIDPETNDVTATEWAWDRLFYDPFSRKHDFSDARYLGGCIWMDLEDAKSRWSSPEQIEALENTVSERDQGSTTYDDKPAWKKWTSGQARKRVRIVQMYYLKGADWYHCTFTKGGKLEEMKVPFVDHNGRSWCPLMLQSAYVDRNNNRYGLVRTMIGPQDEVNKRRSKALHLLNARTIVYEDGAVDDIEEARKELAKPDGLIRRNPGFEFEEIDKKRDFAGHLELLQEAKNEIDLIGPNAAMLGKGPDAASGRAILANKQGGQTEISRIMDRHRHLKGRVFRGIWDLIRQYKTEEWWVRVTDDEKNVKFVGLNRPVTMGEELQKRLEQSGLPPEEIQARMQQVMADPRYAQQLQQVVRVENQPNEMFMDITIEEVPDVANVQEEQFQALTALAPAVVFPPEVYIKASSLRNKSELLELLQSQQNDPVQQEIQQKQLEQAMAKADAEVQKLLAEIDKIKADTIGALATADQTDAQTGSIVNPAIVEPGGGAPQSATSQPNGSHPPQQAGF